MCSIPKASTPPISEQLNKSNALLSNEEVAHTVGEKKSNKRTVTSLRVPVKNQSKTGAIGISTDDTTTGLNIPV